MYKIEKGVPIPGRSNQRYPLKEMEPGDSFFVPVASETLSKRVQSSIRTLASQFGVPITLRRVDGGVRCWRKEEPPAPFDYRRGLKVRRAAKGSRTK